jgi:hypothetical protein
MEHPYKFIYIGAHGGTMSYYKTDINRILPFVEKNNLDSLQSLTVPPRSCVNLTNNILRNKITLNLFSEINKYVPSTNNKGLFEEIDGTPLDKILKDNIFDLYNDENGIPNYFKKGEVINRKDIFTLKLTEPKNISGFLTTYSWEKNDDIGIMSYTPNAPDRLTQGFNIGIIVLKETNYFLAPSIFQPIGKEGFLLGKSYVYLIQNFMRYSRELKTVLIGSREVVGTEGYCENIKIHTEKKNTVVNLVFLIKVFIEKGTGLVYFKLLPGYNFLSSPIFIEYISKCREGKKEYKWKLEDGTEHTFPVTQPFTYLCKSSSIFLLKSIHKHDSFFGTNHGNILNIEKMVDRVYNFELDGWFENDGYVSYISTACRSMDPINEYSIDYHYSKKGKNKYDEEEIKEMMTDVRMSPRSSSSSSGEQVEERTWAEWLMMKPKRKYSKKKRANRRQTKVLGGQSKKRYNK